MKKRTISLYIKEIFINPGLYVSILIVAVLTLLACEIEGNGGYINMTMNHIVAGDFTKNVACIPAALPVIVTFCDDCKYQYLRPVVTRCGVRKYTLAKFLASALSAFLVVALGIIIAMTVMSTYTPITCDPSFPQFGYGPYAAFETMGLPALTFITRSFLFAAYAAAYTLVGLAVAAFIPNKFLVFAVPFAAGFLFQEISFHIYALPRDLNISELQTAPELFEGKGMLFNAAYDLMFPLLIAVILYCIFHYAVEKRVRCEIS